MSGTTENLERYFNSFINLSDDYGFFLGIAEYAKYAVETPEIDKIIKTIVEVRTKYEQDISNCEGEGIKALDEAKKSLLKRVKEGKVMSNYNEPDYETLAPVKKFEDIMSGDYSSSDGKFMDLAHCLPEITDAIIHFGYKHITDKFVETDKNGRKTIKANNIWEKISLYHNLKRKFEEKEKTELWGAWDRLELVYLYIFQYAEEKENLITGVARISAERMADLYELSFKLDEVIAGGVMPFNSYEKQKYKSDATRIHNYLIKELSKKSEALRGLEALNEMQSIRLGMIDAPKPELSETEKASLRTKSQQQVIEKMAKNAEPTNKKITAKKSNKKDPIRKIVIIKMNDGKQLVAVNDSKETKAIRGYAESWKILEKEIKDRNLDQYQRTGVKDISDAVVDYFNTNKRCPIYMGGKYALTDVIVGRDIKGISPAITTNIMTEKEYMTYKKRKGKKLKRA
jgi:hypothetical protein